MGIDLAKEWNKGFIKKEKEFIRVLGPQQRDLREIKKNELIDVLHYVLILWEQGRKRDMKEVLKGSTFSQMEGFSLLNQSNINRILLTKMEGIEHDLLRMKKKSFSS